jgi:F420-dependent oxidoreductase-like protein
MRIGLVSAAISTPATTLDDLIAEARTSEDAGFDFLSLPNIFRFDAISALTLAGRETQRIELMTGVVPTPPRHPFVMAQQALTAQAACGGRFVLGIGLSHKVVIENVLGLSFSRPARQMREYLEVLMPLARGEAAQFEGEIYRVQANLDVTGAGTLPVVVAALGPQMLALTGELADGTATWMTGERTLADHIVPTITKAASAAGRPQPRVIASLPIALASDPDAAKAAASKIFAMYGTLPSYRAMLDREGAAEPGDVAIAGDEATLRAALKRLADAGVTDFAASLFEAEDGTVERTRAFLLEQR